jgi:hypothetical protein
MQRAAGLIGLACVARLAPRSTKREQSPMLAALIGVDVLGTGWAWRALVV